MHKFLRKITSAITAITLVGTNLMPALVYAASETPKTKNNENIIFDARVKNEYSYTANINENLGIDIKLSVLNDGYIKSGNITIENNNFEIGNVENENINKTDKNKFELEQVNSNESLDFKIPIRFEKQDNMDIDYFDKDSKIKLEAIYVNSDGNEESVSKEITQRIKWDTEAKGFIKQELKRYLKYENKTLISFAVTSGIEGNTIPITEKSVQILAPIINAKEPNKVIVTGENIDYTYQNQIVTISKKFINENKTTWNSNDEYIVTYIYDTQIDETNIETIGAVSLKTISEKSIEARTDKFDYQAKDNVGNLIESSIIGDNNINKGYMYTNLNRKEDKLETPYKSSYKINIGLIDFVDEIHVIEYQSNFETINKKVSIDREELLKILGEEGYIKVLDGKDLELGILNKDNLEVEINNYGIKYIISKPIQEGDINLFFEKAINPNLSYTKESLATVDQIKNSIDVIGFFQGQEISHNYVEKNISLIEPQSNASITINKESLSTIITNEDVTITATLEKNDISDALYTNPELLITLPDKISNISLKDAKLIYENELVPVDFKLIGKQIYLKLEGTQTQYSNVPTADGTIVRIVADLTLDNFSVSSEENIILQYTNLARNEIKSVSTPIKIVAPTGFVTANYGTLNQTITAISDDATVQIAANDKEKQIKLGGIIVSNLQGSTNNVRILGRIPAQETALADQSNKDLKSTFTTSIVGGIEVKGLFADIYYSDNGNANYNLNDESNGWQTEPKATTKSFLIVAKNEVIPAQRIEFSYNDKTPQNIDYENNAVSTFAVYYDNNSEDGITTNVINSKKLNIATENIPIIKTEITARNFYTDEVIKSGDKVHAGDYIQYTIHATNTGRKAAENVSLKIVRPENTEFYIEEYNEEYDLYNNHLDDTEELIKTIEKIEPGETKDIVVIIVPNMIIRTETPYSLRTELTAENMLESSTASFENTIIEGTLSIRLSNQTAKKEVRDDMTITYSLAVYNNKFESLENVSIKVYIPKYIELTKFDGGIYDEATRTITYNIETLDITKYYQIEAKVAYTEEVNQPITVYAVGSFDGMEKEINSNKLTLEVIDLKGFSASLTSNITGRMLDTDTIEYYLNIKNETKKDAKINIDGVLPNELKLLSYTMKNGNIGYTYDNKTISNLLNLEETIKAGETLKLTVVAKPYILDSIGQVKQVESKLDVRINNTAINMNSIKNEVVGTSNYNTVITEENNSDNENIYSISGKIWYDENKNSKYDESEVGLSKVPLEIYDVIQNTILKDKNGENIKVYTNDNGEYRFENLPNGQYLIIANYDNEAYRLSNYKMDNLSQNEDSDFIEANDKKATTNILTISGENVYNIDLGLKDIENFSIQLINTISKISVIDGKNSSTYDLTTSKASVKLNKKKNSTLVIEYLYKITNEGNVEGYATKVVSNIPKGMQFISELNEDWYINSDGQVVNNSIANTALQPGETIDLKLILVKDINTDEKELLHSSAEIKETYNKYGVTTKILNLEEKDNKMADIIVGNRAEEWAQVTVISISILGIIALIGLGVYKFINR